LLIAAPVYQRNIEKFILFSYTSIHLAEHTS